MAGTKIEGLKHTKVVDGDTIKVEIKDAVESLRLICLDTEESRPGGSKPVTTAGKLASQWAKDYKANRKALFRLWTWPCVCYRPS